MSDCDFRRSLYWLHSESGHCHCSCCGIPVGAWLEWLGRCVNCARGCSRMHGDELQARLETMLATSQIHSWGGIAVMMLDDAVLTNTIDWTQRDGRIVGGVCVVPVPRWAVVIARARAKGTEPDKQALINAVLAAHMPCTSERLPDISAELKLALGSLSDAIHVEVRLVSEDASGITVEVALHVAPDGAEVHDFSGIDQIPPDIAGRARGTA